jgi:hypothetical protein
MNPVVSAATVSPGFFPLLGVPLIAGRYFTATTIKARRRWPS